MAQLAPLADGPKGRVPEIRNAYRYLRGAHSSVEGLFDAAQRLSNARRADNENTKGRMAQEEVDMLRAAVVFTSSGLDASMKRLVNDVGRHLINQPGTAARAQFEAYLKQDLAAPTVNADLRSAIIRVDPSTALIDYYLAARTKASFQGSGDLKSRVRGSLGIADQRVPLSRLKSLDDFFGVRNSIVHSMDYRDVSSASTTARVHRSADQVVGLCGQAFDVAADLMHAAAEVVIACRK